MGFSKVSCHSIAIFDELTAVVGFKERFFAQNLAMEQTYAGNHINEKNLVWE